jgi:hypothetical protein
MKLTYMVFVAAFVLAGLTAPEASATNYAVVTGDWSVASTWSNGVPNDTEEIKIGNADGLTVTVSTNVGNYTAQKIDNARDCTLAIVAGGYIGSGREMHIGDAGMSGSGSDIGYLVQTGGTLDITTSAGKLFIGYKTGGDGTYTISGGSLTGSAGRMYIAASGGDGTVGRLWIVGDAATLNLGGTMYIANDSETSSGNTGSGTIQFDLTAAGTVSALHVAKTVIDSQKEEAAFAALLVNATGAAPAGNLLLIENTGTSAVVGVFDSFNGGPAAEGTIVSLGGSPFMLTYRYVAGIDGVDNDIALVAVPEPATLVVLGLGGLILRRRLV